MHSFHFRPRAIEYKTDWLASVITFLLNLVKILNLVRAGPAGAVPDPQGTSVSEQDANQSSA